MVHERRRFSTARMYFDYRHSVKKYWAERLRVYGRLCCAPTPWRQRYLQEQEPTLSDFDNEMNRLVGAVLDFTSHLLSPPRIVNGELYATQRIVEEGFGTGELTIPLLHMLSKYFPHTEYLGVDLCDEMVNYTIERLRQKRLASFIPSLRIGEVSRLLKEEAALVLPNSVDMVYWGRLGLWLPEKAFTKGLQQVSRMLKPGGCLVVYEPFLEINKGLVKDPDPILTGQSSTIRTIEDYLVRLPRFTNEEPLQIEFCGEQYYVVVFGKYKAPIGS